ncbi:hypothetical protein B0H14DRAFT_3524695 [Mycena olivaceomarginata]|nr:hypothetical protein B0H14DRAFT_3524695 [Mycena olivaceomarginata]
MEHFQFAYGWLTQWSKTFAYILNDKDPNPPDRISFPSVTIEPGVDPWTVKNFEVPVIRTGLDFLNAKVDDPGVHFNEMKDIINAFTFPRMTGRLPITLLRKMVAQNIVSRCRALLSLQPIKQLNHNRPGELGNPDGNTIRTMRSKGIRILSLGFWHRDSSGRLVFNVDWSARRHGRWTDTQKVNRGKIVTAMHSMPVQWLFDGPEDLLASRAERREWAEANIQELANSVNLIDDIRTRVCEESRLRGMNGRSYYRWILELTREGTAIMTYTRGHSAELTLPAQMNREADHYASGAQKFIDLVPHAPTPTFSMDSFTFHTIADGWIESNTLRGLLPCDEHRVKARDRKPDAHAYLGPRYDPSTRLPIHACLLPTAETLEARSKLDSSMCRLGCLAVESMHHIFVDCILFAEWREEAANELVVRTTAKLIEAGIPGEQQQWILHAAKCLFADDAEIWPLEISQYYVGQIPRICDHITATETGTQVRSVWRAGYLGAYSGLWLHELRECSNAPSLTAGTWTSR